MNHTTVQPEPEDSKDEKAVDFDAAITLTGHGKYHHILLLFSGFCLISLIFVTINTSYLLPSAQCEFDMSSQDKGLLNAAVFLGMMTSSHLFGFLADTKGRRNILLFTLCGDACMTIISSFAHTFVFFLFCRFLNGFFICGPSAVMYAYLGEFQTNARRTSVVLWAGTLLSVGIIALPGTAWLVIPQTWEIVMPWHTTYTSWRIFVALCALPSLFTASILGFFLTESPKFLLARGDTVKALQVLRYMYSMNSGKHPDTYPVKAVRMDPTEEVSVLRAEDPKDKFHSLKVMYDQTAPLFQPTHLKKTVLACIIQFGLYTSCNGILLWLPDIFNRQAEFAVQYPNTSATVCNIISILAEAPHPPLDLARSTVFFGSNGTELILNITNTVLGSLNNTVYEYNTHSSNASYSSQVSECVSYVDPTVFQSSLAIGAASGISYVIVGFLVHLIEKKTILVAGLLISAASGVGLYFVASNLAILVLSTMFVVFSGLCISVLNSAVIDVYPTHLRAMAVCISLMFGRAGTVFGSLLMGELLEFNCATVYFILSGIVLLCGIMSSFFPSPASKKMHKIND